MSKNIAIIVAGGTGTRMGTAVPKQFLELKGKPILAYTLETFQNSACIDGIVLVVGHGEEAYVRREIVEKYGFSKVTTIAEGGAQRYESVYAGLKCCEKAEYVFVQDAVRPFVTEEILQRGWEAVRNYGSAVCGMPSKDTVKITDPWGMVQETPSRERVWIVQTPQIFLYSLIRNAYDRILDPESSGAVSPFMGKTITDDAMIVESMGAEVHMFEGDYRNIKITTPEDLQIAEAFL